MCALHSARLFRKIIMLVLVQY